MKTHRPLVSALLIFVCEILSTELLSHETHAPTSLSHQNIWWVPYLEV
jgi:hypothetical protein